MLLELMRRFARINPRQLDPIALKKVWIEMSDLAEAQITHLADTQPDIPIGVAFVDREGRPGWIGDDSSLRVHHPSIYGCWPTVTPLPEAE